MLQFDQDKRQKTQKNLKNFLQKYKFLTFLYRMVVKKKFQNGSFTPKFDQF